MYRVGWVRVNWGSRSCKVYHREIYTELDWVKEIPSSESHKSRNNIPGAVWKYMFEKKETCAVSTDPN
jgi:hypothetical protein